MGASVAKVLNILGDEGNFTRMATNLASQLDYDEIRVWGDELPNLPDQVNTAPLSLFSQNENEDLFIGFSDGAARMNAAKEYPNLVNLIHPSAVVDPTAKLGKNLYMDALTYVGMYAELGDGITMSSKSTIEHDNKIGSGIMYGASATSCGHVQVGDLSFVGANAVISPRVKIGENVVVGAGAVVVKDLPESGTYAGNPARKLR